MTELRKTPRTDRAVDNHSFLDGSRELHPDIIPFIQALEIETQELAEVLEELVQCAMECPDGAKPFVMPLSVNKANHAIARHHAKQEVKS